VPAAVNTLEELQSQKKKKQKIHKNRYIFYEMTVVFDKIFNFNLININDICLCIIYDKIDICDFASKKILQHILAFLLIVFTATTKYNRNSIFVTIFFKRF